jgi:hypothetical protein
MIPIPQLTLDNIILIWIISIVTGIFLFTMIAVLDFMCRKIEDVIKTYNMYKSWDKWYQDKKEQ